MQALWMLVASALFALMGALIKFSTEYAVSLPQIVLFRGAPSVLLLLVWARVHRLRLRPQRWMPHLRRNLAGVTSMWLGFYALSQLPLGTATSLGYTSPLFIACWLLWRGDQRDAVRIFCVLLGFVGVAAVLRPDVASDQWRAVLAGLGGGALGAFAMMQLRAMGQAGEAEWRSVLIFSCVVCASSLVGVGVDGWPSLGLPAWGTLSGVGITGLFGQLALTRAFGVGAPLLTAALQYSTIIFATLLGMLFWDDAPDAVAWAGVACIIATGLISVWWTLRITRREAMARAAVKVEVSGRS